MGTQRRREEVGSACWAGCVSQIQTHTASAFNTNTPRCKVSFKEILLFHTIGQLRLFIQWDFNWKKNKRKRWKPYRSLSKCDNNRAPFFRLSVQRLSISLGFEYSWAFVQLVIPMTEHQLQMPVSLADPLAADESYFSSTDWDAVLQIKKK